MRAARWRSMLLVNVTVAFATAVSVIAAPASASVSNYQRTGLTELTTTGGRVEWSPDGATIYFDRKQGLGSWEVWKMNSNGTGQRCLTCNLPSITDGGNRGQPAISPDGRWLAFQAAPPAPYSDPGAGYKNNLWVLDLEATPQLQAYKLYDVQAHSFPGTLHASFNHAGTKLFWTDFENPVPFGNPNRHYPDVRLLVADFVTSPAPSVQNITAYNPGPNPNWMESHGWAPDDASVYFTCTGIAGQNDNGMDICTMSFTTPTQITRLTTTSGSNGETREWDEHAHLSPFSDAYAWMSSQPYGVVTGSATSTLKTDLWMMNTDGSGQTRITGFNNPASPDYLGTRTIVGDMAWSPDGSKLAMFLITSSLVGFTFRIWVATFVRV